MKYNDDGTIKEVKVKSFDTLPVGAEVDYDGSVVPDGWTEVSDYDSDWISIGESKFGCYYKKEGNVVTIRGISQTNITLTGFGQTSIGTLPSEIRPSTTLRFPIYSRANSTIYGNISSTGALTLFNWDSEKTFEAGQIGFTITYLI